MSVKDYNVEPELNVSISGINIAEGCAPSGINDAIRQLMADVKEESAAQAQAVNEAEAAVSTLDSTLRALIAQEVAKCLKTSGGLMSGNLNLGFGANITKDANNSELLLCGGTSWQGGSFVAVHGKEHAGAEGCLDLTAMRDGYANCQIFLRPGEMPLANGSPILTSAGGMLYGMMRQAVGDVLAASRDDMWTSLKGGSEHDRGAAIILYGQDHSGGGCAQLQAHKAGVGGTTLSVWPNGAVDVNGNAVLTTASGTAYASARTPNFVTGETTTSFMLPAGGTWTYFWVRNVHDSNVCGYGTAAGGTAIGIGAESAAYFAVRIG